LDWKRFVVAETHDGGFIGCGQLKPHKDSSLELASIAVDASYRGQGVARAMIEHLLASSLLAGRPRPLCGNNFSAFLSLSPSDFLSPLPVVLCPLAVNIFSLYKLEQMCYNNLEFFFPLFYHPR